VSEFGIDRARELAAESHRAARHALAEASAARGSRHDASELEQIADFIYTRTS
jgi:geranylgeranyl diphosphate synthase type II